MNPIVFALRHPITVMVGIAALVLGAGLAATRMKVDVFPDLNVPVIYVAQPYGGMDPQQMEAFLTYYYEYHFLYITGIHHVESKNIQSVALMKLYFHPGGNQRTIVLRADPKQFQKYNLSPDEVVAAIASGNQISPSGNVAIDGKAPMVPVNSVVGDNIKALEDIPIRLGTDPTVYVGDVAHAINATDIPTGYGLVNGKR